MKEEIFGDFKIVRKFAWWPTLVSDKIIWLKHYAIEYKWTVRLRATPFLGIYLYKPNCGGWDECKRYILR